MSSFPVASSLADFVTCPLSGASAVLAVTTTAANQDLRLVGNQTINTAAQKTETSGLAGHYVTLIADGGDVYVAFGVSSAAVSGANAPAPATTGVNAVGNCYKIPKDQTLNVIPRPGVDNFVAYVTSTGTATLRLFQSSI